jgi:hypothetical protein
MAGRTRLALAGTERESPHMFQYNFEFDVPQERNTPLSV